MTDFSVYVMPDHEPPEGTVGETNCKGARVPGYVSEVGDNDAPPFKHFHCNYCGWTTRRFPRRPNEVKIRYDREEMFAILDEMTVHKDSRLVAILDEYEKRRAEGEDRPCQSEVHHGPGHQSSTYCQSRGDHVVHEAYLPSGGYAEWSDDDPYARD